MHVNGPLSAPFVPEVPVHKLKQEQDISQKRSVRERRNLARNSETWLRAFPSSVSHGSIHHALFVSTTEPVSRTHSGKGMKKKSFLDFHSHVWK
ncbi:hypothetical protein CEXT_117041 [Caerostris extrusa]|uniref:Uncharacterized protein n=1 Tax=Caerostris extrusa TaxID=172846 RepID=A0AAV4WQM2_CAEEX|nr:hypothetical protein CEXT_117041 [Caerostris extrusa]